jgi:hexosaminidase
MPFPSSGSIRALVLAASALSILGAQTRLQLRWELKENRFSGSGDEGHSTAQLTLRNLDSKPLPAQGWAIYFNAFAPIESDSVTGGMRIEPLGGGLSKMVPTGAFHGLAPDQALQVSYVSPYLLTKPANAMAGPYLVFDSEPSKGYPLDFAALPLTRPEQLDKGPLDRVPLVTPHQVYTQNAAIRDLPEAGLPPIFPTPLKIQRGEGLLHLAALPKLSAPAELKVERAEALDLLRPFLGTAKTAGPVLELALGKVAGQASPEAYALTIQSDRLRIVGNSAAGVHLGLQSLRDLLPLKPHPAQGLDLPVMEVVDAPRFAHRGMHLDTARNFQSKAEVLRVLDLMARFKLNVFHFHLTDDEGWRLEIPGLPELTQVGGLRGHTLDRADCLPPAYGSGPSTDNAHGSGHYRRAEFIDILRHAMALHIQVLPEIEMPGHARAAVTAMEARFKRLSQAGDPHPARFRLRDPGDRSVYLSAQLFSDNLMDPGLPSTYAFIEKVVSEVAAMYQEAGAPLPSMHMGGDEVPEGAWEKSPACLALMKSRGWPTTNELWYHFYDRVAAILQAKGITLSGWEELTLRRTKLDGRPVNIPNPDYARRGYHAFVWNNVMGWGAEDLPYRLANAGFQVVLAPVTNLYFDLAYNKNPEEPGLTWGGYNDLPDSFGFIPFDYYKNARTDRHGNPLDRSILVGKDRLTEYGQGNILGIEGCLWAETLTWDGALDYMLLPKLLGLAERAWAPDPAWAREPNAGKAASLQAEAWSQFVNTAGKRLLPRLDQEGLNWRYRIPSPGLRVEGGEVHCNLQIPGFVLRYTTDGSEPTASSPAVRGPIREKGVIAVAAFTFKGRHGGIFRIENR